MRIDFVHKSCISKDDFIRNTDHSRSLGLPSVEKIGASGRDLAIVGGGHSVTDHVETLRNWPGDIWAMNGAFHWCRDHGIEAAFFTVDAQPQWSFYAEGAKRAIVSTSCDPSLFDVLKDAEVFTFDQASYIGGSTTATFAPLIGVNAGYSSVSFFGCGSDYAGKSSHIYENEKILYGMTVEVGGKVFATNAAYFMQAEALAKVIREFPHIFKDRSGGLLSALVACPDYEILSVGEDIEAAIRESARAA